MALGGHRDRPSPDGPRDRHHGSRHPGAGRPDGPDRHAPSAPGTEDDETLPCGASLAALWEDRTPPAGHARCPHCRAALDDLTALDDAVVQALASRHPGAGGTAAGSAGRQAADRLTDDFTARVMDVVRTELRPGRTLPLGGHADDDWITEAAAARSLRAAADSVPGVVAGSCRIVPLRPPASGRLPLPGARLPRGPLRVRIKVAVSPRWTLPGAAALVRERVAAAAGEDLGLHVCAIDVSVIDLLDDPGPDDGPAGTERSAP